MRTRFPVGSAKVMTIKYRRPNVPFVTPVSLLETKIRTNPLLKFRALKERTHLNSIQHRVPHRAQMRVDGWGEQKVSLEATAADFRKET